ncbi:MAG: Hint domain-containing protein, partial [Salibaculum sp.]|uniref:Hint domain-containing protein n=1 Tax=Salibaculum sp. TaxID=2855480 RepID=UPI00287072E2
DRPMAVLRFDPDQVGSTNNVNQNGNEAVIDITKTFADVGINDGVAYIEATVDDSELVVNDANDETLTGGSEPLPSGTPDTGETNFLEKTQGDANTTFTSLKVVMNDGTEYTLKDGSPIDFREQDTSDPLGSFTPEHGDTHVESNGAISLVDSDGNDAPTGGSGDFSQLSGQNLMFSSAAGWNTGSNTRLIDSSGDTTDDEGDGLFTVDSAICFARGTRIKTDRGAVPVEDLAVGDLVEILDNGLQPIRWVRSDRQPLEEAAVDAKPVQIKAGALGPGLPSEDLIVSAQHRILVGGAGQFDAVFDSEALAPAKSLTGAPGIRHMKGKQDITWVHFACDRHEVVIANGCQSESLLLGPMALTTLAAAERRAVTDLFGPAPVPGAALNGPPARDCLKVGVARRRIAAHRKANTSLTASVLQTAGQGGAAQDMTTASL